jgi:hypothetical protein
MWLKEWGWTDAEGELVKSQIGNIFHLVKLRATSFRKTMKHN